MPYCVETCTSLKKEVHTGVIVCGRDVKTALFSQRAWQFLLSIVRLISFSQLYLHYYLSIPLLHRNALVVKRREEAYGVGEESNLLCVYIHILQSH